jgi:hypothetical protein
MTRIASHYMRILYILEKLHTSNPTIPLGQHLATALDESGELFSLTDKEIYDAVNSYTGTLEYDVPHIEEQDLDKIIQDGTHLQAMMVNDAFDNEDD